MTTTMHYNYIRPHSWIGGRIPAGDAGIEIRSRNKWLMPFQNAAAAA